MHIYLAFDFYDLDPIMQIYIDEVIIPIYLYKQYETMLESYNLLLEQAGNLELMYSTKQNIYINKYDEYNKNRIEAQSLLNSYYGTIIYNYYTSTPEEREEMINNYIDKMKTAWNNFVLALDTGYTDEVERGLYY